MLTHTDTDITPRHRRPVRRVLLLPIGEPAVAVAQRIYDLSQDWLNSEPPVAILSAPTPLSPAWEATMPDEQIRAVDRLFSQELMEALTRSGLRLERPNELLLWLLVSLEPEQETSMEPELLQRSLERLTDLAWQRLRVHITPHILFLAEPAIQTHLVEWCTMATAAWGPSIYVAGPVTHAHLRLPDEEWFSRAATGVAALLWSDQTGGDNIRAHPRTGETIQALGAAVWEAPLATLRTYLAESFARRVVARLQEETNLTLTGDGLATQTKSLDNEMAALLKAAPTPITSLSWGNRQPGLAAVVNLPSILRREVEQREKQHRELLHSARRDWLENRLSIWQQTLDRFRQDMLMPEQAWPSLQGYRTVLQRQREETLRMEQAVEAQLVEWGERLSRVDAQVEAATRCLQSACELFPTPDLAGALRALTHPWQVIRWAWAYAMWLPSRSQQLLDALTRRSQIQWHEANWHVLRQLYLAMAQDLQLELAAADVMEAALTGVAQSLDADGCVQAAELAPWTQERLEGLSQQIFADDGPCAWDFLAYTPLPCWPEEPPHALADRLTQWAMPWLDGIRDWTAVDCVVEALPGDALEAWLAQLADLAQPLWPDEELRAERQEENYLFLPPVSADSQDPEQGARRQRLEKSAAQPNRPELIHAHVIGWLRFSLVDVVPETGTGEA